MSPLRALMGSSTSHDLETALAALADCGIADLAERRVDSLSGGQRQRVAIARALVNEPTIVLADEPTGNLDIETGTQIVDLLLDLNRECNGTLVVITHNPRDNSFMMAESKDSELEYLKLQFANLTNS
mgnify:CR=1 FL=1